MARGESSCGVYCSEDFILYRLLPVELFSYFLERGVFSVRRDGVVILTEDRKLWQIVFQRGVHRFFILLWVSLKKLHTTRSRQ